MEVPPGSARSNPGSKPSRLSLLAGCLPSTSADESLSWRIVLYFTSRCSPLPLPLLPRRRDHKLLNIKPCFQSVRRGGGCQGLHVAPPPPPPPFFFFLHLRRHLDRRRSSTSLLTYPCLRYVHASRGSTYKAELRLSPFVVRVGAPADLQYGSLLKTTYIFPDNLSPNGPQSLIGMNGDATRIPRKARKRNCTTAHSLSVALCRPSAARVCTVACRTC